MMVMAKKVVMQSTKSVRNRSGHRVELIVDGNVRVLFPGDTISVPVDTEILEGIGLLVR